MLYRLDSNGAYFWEVVGSNCNPVISLISGVIYGAAKFTLSSSKNIGILFNSVVLIQIKLNKLYWGYLYANSMLFHKLYVYNLFYYFYKITTTDNGLTVSYK